MRAGEDESLAPTVASRPDWAGVAPRPLPSTPQPVVAIGREGEHGDAMDVFWAAVAAGELSERVLALTEEIILQLNSSNYTVWEWRWRCIQALGGPEALAAREKALMAAVASDNPKNYQLWNARRRHALALGISAAEEELEFAAGCLLLDAKNYHAWAHRQAVLASLGCASPALWRAELAYTERLLRDDVRNNSAWNQRAFVLTAAPEGALAPPAEAYGMEVEWTASKLRLAPHNEAAWAYLRGLAVLRGAPAQALAADPRLMAACREALAACPSCVPALALLADVLTAQAALLEGAAAESGGSEHSARSGRLGMAAQRARRGATDALHKLAVADPLRRSYYELQAAAVR